MADQSELARRGFALSQPGDALGVSCDDKGPSLGPIRLLEKGAFGFWPRPIEDLEAILSAAFEEPVSCEGLVSGLAAVARALQAKDMTRAIFATQYLRLPELTEEQARRATATEALRKASTDDPKHPGWPKGAPDHQGGRFRPKSGDVAEPEADNSAMVFAQAARQKLKEKTKQRLLRRTVRTLLKNLVTWKRILRFGGELASNVVPGADIIGDAALIADIVEAVGESESLMAEADKAIEFLNKGPYSIEQLQASSEYSNFSSFNDFKKSDFDKVFGAAGEGQEWHHIVEQGVKEDGISLRDLQSTKNIIRLPKIFHEMITSESASIQEGGGSRLRDALRGRSFDNKYAEGLEALKRLGILKE